MFVQMVLTPLISDRFFFKFSINAASWIGRKMFKRDGEMAEKN